MSTGGPVPVPLTSFKFGCDVADPDLLYLACNGQVFYMDRQAAKTVADSFNQMLAIPVAELQRQLRRQ